MFSTAYLAATVVILVAVGAGALTIYTALKRKSSGAYLCDDCKFNDPEQCLKSERPHALICTSYRRVQPAAASKS